MNHKLSKIFKASPRLLIDNNTKIVIMSDCHRGAGDKFDNFLKNKSIYLHALHHYYQKGFTYIELGDGDEMWEVKNYKDIIYTHLDIFKLLKKFYNSKRLIMIYGNHDIVKKSPQVITKYFYKYYDKNLNKEIPLLYNLTVNESLILNYYGYNIFLIHGHQVDLFNSLFWKLSRFLVQNFYRILEKIDLKNFTSIAKNHQIDQITEKKLNKWSSKNHKMLITGHTHRAVLPQLGQSLYFNAGSCIHPNGITCLEIEKGNITLVRWKIQGNNNKTPSFERVVLAESERIINYFK